MSASRLRASAIAVGLGLVLAPALSGCIPSVDDIVGGIVQQGVEQGIENLAGIDLATGSLPNGFPQEVPLVEGELIGGATASTDGKQGWVVSITTDRSPADIKAQLEAAGFTSPEDSAGVLGDSVFLGENDRYAVLVVMGEDSDGKLSVNYTVTQK